MPRSGPGRVTGLPSSRIVPVVGVSSPATMRSKVDLPQPDGPRMVTKSLSATSRLVGSSARVGWRRHARRKDARDVLDAELGHVWLHGKQPAIDRLEQEIRDQPDDADDDDAEDDLAGREQRLAVDDHVTDAGRRADQFGDDHIGPGPAQHEAQNLGDVGRRRRDQHARRDAAVARAERQRGLDQIAARAGNRHAPPSG